MEADKKAPGAVTLDTKTRAVIFDPAVKMSPEAFKGIREICPFDIPRHDEKTRRHGQVHDVLRPDQRGPASGLRQVLPHGNDELRRSGRHPQDGPEVGWMK